LTFGDLLQRDARTTQMQIADAVGLSQPSVADRIRKLDESGLRPRAPFYPADPCRETLRLNFSNRPPLAIAEGMGRLGACVRARLREAGLERRVAG
jgi:AsnC-type helix-turn-helix domain